MLFSKCSVVGVFSMGMYGQGTDFCFTQLESFRLFIIMGYTVCNVINSSL